MYLPCSAKPLCSKWLLFLQTLFMCSIPLRKRVWKNKSHFEQRGLAKHDKDTCTRLFFFNCTTVKMGDQTCCVNMSQSLYVFFTFCTFVLLSGELAEMLSLFHGEKCKFYRDFEWPMNFRPSIMRVAKYPIIFSVDFFNRTYNLSKFLIFHF